MVQNDEKKQTIETYNRSATAHAEKFNEIGARIKDIKKTFSYIKKLNPKTIEIGCGNGRDAKEIVNYTNDYLGIDLSEEMLKLAQQNNPEVKFKLADFETYRFPNKVDIVFAFASILHSNREYVKDILKKAHKALHSGGVFFISSKYGPYHKEIIDKESHGPKTYYFYSPEEIKKLSPPGLKIVYQEIQNFRGIKWFNVILQKSPPRR